TLQIPLVANTISRVYLMNNPGTSLTYSVSGGNITVSVPATPPHAHHSVVVVEVTGIPAVGARGVFKLTRARGGQALDDGTPPTAGAQARQWTDNGGSPQQWRLTGLEAGRFKLVCARSGMALDNGGSTTDGTALVQQPDNGSNQQQWSILALGGGY